MTYKLSATVTHKSFDKPVEHEFYYTGDTLDDIIAKIQTLPQHEHNLKNYGKTSFKDENGVKHQWKLELMHGLN